MTTDAADRSASVPGSVSRTAPDGGSAPPPSGVDLYAQLHIDACTGCSRCGVIPLAELCSTID